MDFSLPLIIVGVLVSFFVATQLLKRFAKAEPVFNIISLLRTKRFNASADAFAKNKWLERLAELGVILGFGVLAIDFLYARKMPKAKRALVLIGSAIALGLFLIAVSEPIGIKILENPLFSNTVSIAIIVSFALLGFAGFTLALLAYSAIDIVTKVFAGSTPCPGIAPIIPGVQFPNVPKELTPPLHIWLVFFVLLFVHEFSHGILMRRAKIQIKSFGLLLLGYLPFGAFAEPNEKQLKKITHSAPEKALKVYAAGPASNLYSIPIIIAIMLLYSLLVFSPFVLPFAKTVEAKAVNGIIVGQVDANYSFCGTTYKNPAFGILEKGMIVKQINGTTTKVPSDLAKIRYKETDNNFLVDANGTLLEKHFSFSEKNQLGLRALNLDINRNKDYNAPKLYGIVATTNNLIDSFLTWLFLLSIAVATANFLPMDPFDGGRMIKILLLPYLRFLKMSRADTEKLIGRVFLWIVLGLILLNALPLFLIK